MGVQARNQGGPFEFICDTESDLATIVNPRVGEIALVKDDGSIWFHTGTQWQEISGGSGSGDITTDTAWAAKGDLIVATGDNAASVVTVGANDSILMADSAQANGVKWAAAAGTANIADVSSSESAGTSDTFARGDHVHAHEAAHVAHDTLWDAAGDLVVGSGSNTAARLAIGANGTVLTSNGTTASWETAGAASVTFISVAKWGAD